MIRTILPYLIVVGSTLIASFSQVLLKKSADKTYPNRIREYLNVYVVTGYGMTFGSMLLSILAYSMMDYKYGPMLEATGYIFVCFLSYWFFREKITGRKLIGTVLIFLGLAIFLI